MFQEVIIDEAPLATVRINDCSVGDFDGDGYPDFWLSGRAGPGHTSAWYRNPGPDPSSLPWQRFEFSEGSWKYGIVGDVDGDGDDDILGNRDVERRSVWAENDGTPTVGQWPVHDLGRNGRPDLYYMSDFNNDGITELVLMFKNGPIVILRNPGDPTQAWLRTEIPVVESAATAGGAIGDVDNDGDQDIVYGNKWYENPGLDWTNAASWTQRVIDSSWPTEARAYVIDIDRNGRSDIILTGEESHEPGVGVAIFTTFDPDVEDGWTRHSVDSSYINLHSLQVNDFDNDGDFDIYTAEMHFGRTKRVVVFEQDGNIDSWIPHVLSTVGSHNSRVADFDLDGRMDIVGKNFEDDFRPRIWFNRNPSTVLSLDDWDRHVIETSLPHDALFIDAKDLNGDGLADLVAGAWWWPNPGTLAGVWTRQAIAGGFNNFGLAFDFDHDGDQDLFGTDGAHIGNDLLWARNDGTGLFTTFDVADPGAGDFLQGLTVGHALPGQNVQLYLSWHRQSGMGTGQLQVPLDPSSTSDWGWQSISPFSSEEELVLGDVNRDGRPDLHMGTQWLRQELDGSFSLQTGIDPILGGDGDPDRVRLADMDHDGDLDVVVGAEHVSMLLWAENQGEGASWITHTIATDFLSMSLDVGDIDKDGDIDVVAGAHKGNGEVSIYENVAGGSSWVTHVVDAGQARFDHHDGTLLRDMDSDGDLDIISVGFRYSTVVIYENTSSGGVSPPVGLSPIADGGANQTVIDDDNNGFADVSLDGSGSADPDGTIVSYEWFEGVVPVVTGQSPLVSLSLGLHTLTLRVTDNDGNFDTDPVTVFVVPESGPPSASLVAHWKFDESSGLIAADAVASRDGTLVNGPTWSPSSGQIDGALEFDGVDDAVELPPMDLAGSAMTIAFWFRADDFGDRYARFISKTVGADNSDHFWMVSQNRSGANTTLRFRLKAGGSTTKLIDDTPLSTGVWTHVAVSYDGSLMRIYLDGAEVASVAKSGTLATDPAVPVAIGNQPPMAPPSPFDGLIDDVRIYSGFLSAADIALLASGAAPPAPAPPSLLSVTAVDATTVQIVFDEDVDLVSAETLANYSIMNGVAVAVTSATLGADNRTLTLGTDPLSFDVPYTLTVTGVLDLDTPPNAANDSETFLLAAPALTPPSLVSIVAIDSNTVEVLFNEDVDPASAGTPANYSIMNGSAVAVTSASLGGDNRTVTLGTAPLTFGVLYTLTVVGVSDLDSPPGAANDSGTFLLVSSDLTPPSLVSVDAIDSNTVEVLFDEDVDLASAETPANYVIMNGSAVAVTSAMLGGDNRTVMLATDTLSFDVSYALTVTGVLDLAVPANAANDSAGFLLPSPPGGGPNPASLIAYWKFDESSGLIAADSAASGDGILVNGPAWTPSMGRIDGALEFDGVDDVVALPALDLEGSAMTIAFWFLADDFEDRYARFISKTLGGRNNDYFWMVSQNKSGADTTLRFRLKAGGSTTKLIDDTPLTTGVWTHVAVSYDGSWMRIYLNGAEVAFVAKSGAMATDPTALVALGNRPPGVRASAFDGLLDDVRIYNDSLSAEEIALLASRIITSAPDPTLVPTIGRLGLIALALAGLGFGIDAQRRGKTGRRWV